MLGLFLLLGANLQRVVDEWRRSAEFSVYLRDDAAQPERDAVRRALAEHPAIAGIDAVSKEDALERFRRDLPRTGAGNRRRAREPVPGVVRGAAEGVGRRRRRPRQARRADRCDARRRRRPLRPAMARSPRLAQCIRPVCRPRPGRHPRPGCRPDGDQRRPPRALRAARRGGDHGTGRRPDGVHPRTVRLRRNHPGGDWRACWRWRCCGSCWGWRRRALRRPPAGMFDVQALAFIPWASMALVVARRHGGGLPRRTRRRPPLAVESPAALPGAIWSPLTRVGAINRLGSAYRLFLTAEGVACIAS